MKNIKQLVLVLSVIVGMSSCVIVRAETSFNLIDGEPIRVQGQSTVALSHISTHHVGRVSSRGSKATVQAEQ